MLLLLGYWNKDWTIILLNYLHKLVILAFILVYYMILIHQSEFLWCWYYSIKCWSRSREISRDLDLVWFSKVHLDLDLDLDLVWKKNRDPISNLDLDWKFDLAAALIFTQIYKKTSIFILKSYYFYSKKATTFTQKSYDFYSKNATIFILKTLLLLL